ncbi:hypothetical protein GSI_05069 [Ganoderma sinense ZZ0214-1]|uniref:Transposase family Tnp2 protein n=1 Tax=Ganoderma sinense ZZ0214-1 TaxID=1077348 RepID=A0A2G8SGS4_9APHY|nr:hypothetical protein GSI_05069 [Ganoderma sinense ZZ0214-1]
MAPSSTPRTARATKKKCPCCGQDLHPETVSRHVRGKVNVRAQYRLPSPVSGRSHDADAHALPPPPPRPPSLSAGSSRVDPANNSLDSYGLDLSDAAAADLDAAATNLQESVWAGRTRSYRPPTVEDAEDDDDHDMGEGDAGGPELSLEDREVWERLHAEEQEVAEHEAISVWDELAESFLREGMISGEDLTEEDMRILRPFSLKVDKHIPSNTYELFLPTFPESKVATWKTAQAHVARLSGFQPESYDCCINSCCAFTGPHASLSACPYCSEPRYNPSGKPRKVFIYLPVIPRLKAFLANKPMATEMKYRAEEQARHTPGVIRDVTDSENYRTLLNKNVIVDGKTLSHKYFDDPRDVALGLSTDGFAPFKRCTKTAWPLILFNYNLRPDIRTHLDNILGLGVIPGPKKPVDFDSFLWPVVREFLRLSIGVHAYDSLKDAFFALRAYLILVFGDMPAISMVMRMKGHNGACPCRMCDIRGVRIPESRNPVHYVPLDRTRHPDILSNPQAVKTYDPAHLPLRTHADFMKQAKEVQFARSENDYERLSKLYGIKGTPILSALSSLSFPSSFPYDFMHLIWENVIKNLMLFWTGKYKDLDEGAENYQFPSAVWDTIGSATADSGASLPYIFGPRPPNVATDKVSWTADTRSFWAQYIAPVVLRGRFLHDKYYDHFVELVRLINICLGFDITTTQVDDVRRGFIGWVKKYEDILAAGPVWASWAFAMERYCGALGPAIRSRRFPYTSLNCFVLDHARLSQIRLLYGLQDTLPIRLTPKEQGEIYEKYDTRRLLPSHTIFTPDRSLTDKVIACLSTRFTALPAAVREALPTTFGQWARFRILPAGDTIRAADMVAPAEDGRDASFVRYELLVDRNARYRNRPTDFVSKTFWGQLRRILVVNVGPILSATPPETKSQTLLLAVIHTCTIESSHNVLDIHYYRNHGRTEVVDLNYVQCCVGRVKDRGRLAAAPARVCVTVFDPNPRPIAVRLAPIPPYLLIVTITHIIGQTGARESPHHDHHHPILPILPGDVDFSLDKLGPGTTFQAHSADYDMRTPFRYIYVDFAKVSALQRYLKLKMLVGSYDIYCQYIIHFRERLEAEFPPEMLDELESIQDVNIPDIVAAVGKYHLSMHKPACRPFFSLHNLPGACMDCGETCERLWGITNAVSRRTKEMSAGYRQDALNDLYGDHNVQRVHGLGVVSSRIVMTIAYLCILQGQELSRKLQIASERLKAAKEYLETVEASVEDRFSKHTLIKWRKAHVSWTRDVVDVAKHKSLENPFEPPVDAG